MKLLLIEDKPSTHGRCSARSRDAACWCSAALAARALEHVGAAARLLVADGRPESLYAQPQHLFQPLASGAEGRESTQASGLGLAICHKSRKALGGRICLVKRVDQGRLGVLAATGRLPLAALGLSLNAA